MDISWIEAATAMVVAVSGLLTALNTKRVKGIDKQVNRVPGTDPTLRQLVQGHGERLDSIDTTLEIISSHIRQSTKDRQ